MGIKLFTKAAKSLPKAVGAIPGLAITDVQGDTGTVAGLDAGGNPVAFDSTWTLTATSDTPATLTVSVAGQQLTVKAVGPITPQGTPVTVTITETSADGVVLTDTVQITVTGSSPTSLTVTWLPPTP